MADVLITPADGKIEFKPLGSGQATVSAIEGAGDTLNLVNTSNVGGAVFNIDGASGSLFSVVDTLDGTLMSVNNSAGLPVFEVFSDDSIVAGRFNQNDFVITTDGDIGIGTATPDNKLTVSGDVNVASGSGFKINNAATAGNFLRGDGTRFVANTVQDSDLGSGTANSSAYLRGDRTWQVLNPAAVGAAAASHTHAISDVTSLQTNLDAKAPLASPTFTGTPAAPTASGGTNTTQIATTAFVRGEISSLVDSAPGTLDTLNELAAALGDDPNFATTVTNSIATKADSSHTHAAADINSGTLAIARIPTGTTSSTVCIGNDARLSNARTPTSHTHGNLTNDGKIGSTANLPLITGTGGAVQAGSFGTQANTFCQGNDSRLSNARTPTAHTHTEADIDSGQNDGGTYLQADGIGGAFWNTVSFEDLEDLPSTFPPSAHTHDELVAAGNNPVTITTDSTERLRVSGTGLVGIGTDSPAARLTIKGSGTTSVTSALQVTDSNSAVMFEVKDDATTYINSPTTNVVATARLEAKQTSSTGTSGTVEFHNNYSPAPAYIPPTGKVASIIARGDASPSYGRLDFGVKTNTSAFNSAIFSVTRTGINVVGTATCENLSVEEYVFGVTNTTLTGNAGVLNPSTPTLRLTNSSGSEYTLSGISAYLTTPDGAVRIITCKGTGNIRIINEDTAVTATTRIITDDGSDYILTPNASVIIQYDHDSDRWRVISGTDALALTGGTITGQLEVTEDLIARGYLENTSAPTISSGTLTLNLNTSRIFLVSLNANITTLTISNTPSASSTAVSFTVVLTADGTARSVTWPASIKWADGTAPTLTSTNNKKDVLSFVSTDNGTSWLGFVGGQNY